MGEHVHTWEIVTTKKFKPGWHSCECGGRYHVNEDGLIDTIPKYFYPHEWDKGKAFGGRVRLGTIKCIKCGAGLLQNTYEPIAQLRERKDCSVPS